MKTKAIIFLTSFLFFLAAFHVNPAFAKKPSASFTFTASGLTVDFDASSSSDPDGFIASYSWDFGDGSPNGSGVTPSHTYATAGTYTVALTVTDNDGETDLDTQTITVNSPPVAEAGPDQTPFVGDTVTLDGSASSDVDGDPLTFAWSFVSVPFGSTATLSDPTAVNPTFDVDLFGTYVVQLIVNDGTVDSAPASVTINTLNSPPVADAGPDQTPFVTDTVTLDGSASSDVDGDPLTYFWSITSQPLGSTTTLSDSTAVNPTFYVDKFGTYVVQLIVNDGTVDSVPDTVTIITENSAPQALAVLDPPPAGQVFLGDTAILDGSGSSDVDDHPLTFLWSFTSLPPGSTTTLSDPTAVNPTFIVDAVGTYGIQLIVNDGKVDSLPTSVNVVTGNFLPIADAGPDRSPIEKSSVVLDGTKSSDPDDGINSYSWEQTDGRRVTLLDGDKAQASFTAPEVGDGEERTLIFLLTVTDAGGQKATDSSEVTVKNFEKKNPGASGGGCFIATAAYGSSMDSQVMVLQAYVTLHLGPVASLVIIATLLAMLGLSVRKRLRRGSVIA
jgi:hypothetical protein